MNREFRFGHQSDAWAIARRGRITCSRLFEMIAQRKVGDKAKELAITANYRRELVSARATGRHVDHYVSRAMQDGIEREGAARLLYDATERVMTDTTVAIKVHEAYDFLSGSPDALVGVEGGVEIKAPTDPVHLDYLKAHRRNPQFVPERYIPQCAGYLMVYPEREWWDWVSFNPYFDREHMMIKTRLHREDWASTLTLIEERACAFNEEIEKELRELGFPATQWLLPTKDGHLPAMEDMPAVTREPPGTMITDEDVEWLQSR